MIYSSIFAIYELVMLVTSFLFGAIVDRFQPNLMSGFGLVFTGISTAVFGVLTYINHTLPFVSLAFILRILESLGATAFATSSYSFISSCFPDQTATMFATMEMSFGLGVITGPVVGGLLYGLDGFLLPFLLIGVIMATFGLVLLSKPVGSLFLEGKRLGQVKQSQMNDESGSYQNLPDNPENADSDKTIDGPINESSIDHRPSNVSLRRFLLSPIILVDSFIIITALTLMGFCGATLEPFIRHYQISDQIMLTNLMFVTLGSSYAFSALFWGKACDKFPSLLLIFSIIGSVMTGIGLAFSGPLPFLEQILKPNLWSIGSCMVLFGVGTAAKQVAGYTHALNHTIQKRNFPPSQQTYGYISGMFFSCLSFGGFVGPIIGGGLVEVANFQYASLAMFIIEVVVFLVLLLLQLCCKSFRL